MCHKLGSIFSRRQLIIPVATQQQEADGFSALVIVSSIVTSVALWTEWFLCMHSVTAHLSVFQKVILGFLIKGKAAARAESTHALTHTHMSIGTLTT